MYRWKTASDFNIQVRPDYHIPRCFLNRRQIYAWPSESPPHSPYSLLTSCLIDISYVYVNSDRTKTHVILHCPQRPRSVCTALLPTPLPKGRTTHYSSGPLTKNFGSHHLRPRKPRKNATPFQINTVVSFPTNRSYA